MIENEGSAGEIPSPEPSSTIPIVNLDTTLPGASIPPTVPVPVSVSKSVETIPIVNLDVAIPRVSMPKTMPDPEVRACTVKMFMDKLMVRRKKVAKVFGKTPQTVKKWEEGNIRDKFLYGLLEKLSKLPELPKYSEINPDNLPNGYFSSLAILVKCVEDHNGTA